MTAEEWIEVIRQVEALWGRGAKWAKAESLRDRVRPIPAEVAMRVLNQHVRDGAEYPPAPASLIGQCLQQMPRTEREIPPEWCDHPYESVELDREGWMIPDGGAVPAGHVLHQCAVCNRYRVAPFTDEQAAYLRGSAAAAARWRDRLLAR